MCIRDRYIGSYITAMHGVDGICFTAGVGENDNGVREEICSYFDYLGIKIDKNVNNSVRAVEVELTTKDSKIPVWMVPTNEELAICRETVALVK